MNRKILIGLFVIFFLLFLYSGYHIIMWQVDNVHTSNVVNNIKIISQPEVVDNENDRINFNRLLLENREVVGWIKVNDTNIDYPILKHKDNDYYLNHSFDNSNNAAGWIFMDYRNNSQNFDFNTIIYGHGRKDGSMFGSLINVLNNDWVNKKDNLNILFYTLSDEYLFQIFSIYYIDTTDDYVNINYSDELVNRIVKRSFYDFNIDVKDTDKILTLSTCYNNDKKLVVHAKMIRN